MKTILLKFAGPMQSWGTNSHFNIRKTDYYPSKSAIVGMILGAMGIRREESEPYLEKLNNIDFAVRIDQKGSLLKDLHVAKRAAKRAAKEDMYLTERYYLEDYVCIVAFGSYDHSMIDEISNALKNPYFQPFMGRRSIPLTYDFFIGIYEKNVVDLLKKHKWEAAEWYKRKNRKKEYYSTRIILDADLCEEKRKYKRRDRAITFSQKKRKFGFRYETSIPVYLENPEYIEKTEHDAFGAIGGKDVPITS